VGILFRLQEEALVGALLRAHHCAEADGDATARAFNSSNAAAVTGASARYLKGFDPPGFAHGWTNLGVVFQI
jgi:hypothetical protein